MTEQPSCLSADQIHELQAAAVEALAVLRDLLRDRATGQHYSRVNAVCWQLSSAMDATRMTTLSDKETPQ